MSAPTEKGPSYEALLIIAQSVCGALDRAGVTDCDDPGEAIDVIRENLEARVAFLESERRRLQEGAAAPQPPSGGEVSEVTRLLVERDAAGRKKYGTTLDRTDLSHADWLQHMAEELLDAAGYALAAKRTAHPSAPVGVSEVTAKQKIELVRQGWTAPNPPPSAFVGVDGFDAWWKSHSIDPEFPETMDDRTFAKAAWDAALAQQPAAESEQSIKADAYDMIAESVEKSGVRASSIVDYVTGLIQQPAAVDEAMVERCTDAAIASSTQPYRGEIARDSWRRLVRDVLTAALAAQPGLVQEQGCA